MPALLLLPAPPRACRYEVVGEVTSSAARPRARSRSRTQGVAAPRQRVPHGRPGADQRPGLAQRHRRSTASASTASGASCCPATGCRWATPRCSRAAGEGVAGGPRGAATVQQLARSRRCCPAVGAEAAMYSTRRWRCCRRPARPWCCGAPPRSSRAALSAEGAARAARAAPRGCSPRRWWAPTPVEVPRALARAALERTERRGLGGGAVRAAGASGGMPFGVLYAERAEPFTGGARRSPAALGRLAGEALSRSRARGGAGRSARSCWSAARGVPQDGGAGAAGRGAATSRWCSTASRGREGALRAVHPRRSARALGPFVVVDCRRPPVDVPRRSCSAAPAGRACRRVTSALLRADGGTLLLEAGGARCRGTPPSGSPRLDRRGRRAPARQGGEEPVDVRVIATAWRRCRCWPPRARCDDELAKLLAGDGERDARPAARAPHRRAARCSSTSPGGRRGRCAASRPTLTPDARRLLVDYAWPGNVARAQAARRAARARVRRARRSPRCGCRRRSSRAGRWRGRGRWTEMIARLEKDAIAEALREAKGKKIRAAAILGISRPTLDKKIADYRAHRGEGQGAVALRPGGHDEAAVLRRGGARARRAAPVVALETSVVAQGLP